MKSCTNCIHASHISKTVMGCDDYMGLDTPAMPINVAPPHDTPCKYYEEKDGEQNG